MPRSQTKRRGPAHLRPMLASHGADAIGSGGHASVLGGRAAATAGASVLGGRVTATSGSGGGIAGASGLGGHAGASRSGGGVATASASVFGGGVATASASGSRSGVATASVRGSFFFNEDTRFIYKNADYMMEEMDVDHRVAVGGTVTGNALGLSESGGINSNTSAAAAVVSGGGGMGALGSAAVGPVSGSGIAAPSGVGAAPVLGGAAVAASGSGAAPGSGAATTVAPSGVGTTPVLGGTAAPTSDGGAAAPVSGGSGAAPSGGGAGPVSVSAPAADPRGGIIEDDDRDPAWEGLANETVCSIATTHQSRNPLAPILRSRVKSKSVRGPNTRATQRKKRESRMAKKQAFAEDLVKVQEEGNRRVEELAEAHGMKVQEMKRRVGSLSGYKQKRKTSAYNATVALVMADLNKGRPLGSKYEAKVVRRMLKEDPDLADSYTPEEIEAKREELERKKLLKSMGVRSSNRAATLDAKWTLESIAKEMTDLANRTNIIGFGMFARADLHDTMTAVAIESHGALNFFRDTVGKDAADMLALFELWAVTRKKLEDGELSLVGTCFGQGSPNIVMNFENYIAKFVKGRGIGLMGWPKHVAFKRMGKQSIIGDLKILYQALKDGSCRWMKLSKKQQEELIKEEEEKIENGEKEEKVKKQRSDKGGTHEVRNPKPRAAKKTSCRVQDTDTEEDGEVDGDDEDEEDNDLSASHRKKSVSKPKAKKPTAKASGSASSSNKSGSSGGKAPASSRSKSTNKRRSSADHDEQPLKKRKRKVVEEEEPAKQKKRKREPSTEDDGSALKRLYKQMKKVEVSKESERPKPRPIVKGKAGGPPGLRQVNS
ncbi:hypothetical protein K438DRAFT_2015752 [Mycena galopus ATCC 62051]|nr:hypothetical protein K438DRAFT_2015752 [Mycena galopus ATCC 62051]